MLGVQRKYRNRVRSRDLVSFRVQRKESDLLISAERDLIFEAERLTEECRKIIEDYIKRYPQFKHSLQPINTLDAPIPGVVREMLNASRLAKVGPMAAIAGAVAEYVGKGLLNFSPQVIVENGGDIFIKSSKDRIVGIYAGESILSGKISLKVAKARMPLGICTSSGTLGHSLSFGKADSVTVISDSTPLADAAATAVGNLVKAPEDISRGIELARVIKGIRGVAIIIEEKFGVWGEVEIV
jgi:ApbE superfamily uncharacterized protein (UPF0280 family)